MLNKIKGAKIAPFFMSDRYRLNVIGSSWHWPYPLRLDAEREISTPISKTNSVTQSLSYMG